MGAAAGAGGRRDSFSRPSIRVPLKPEMSLKTWAKGSIINRTPRPENGTIPRTVSCGAAPHVGGLLCRTQLTRSRRLRPHQRKSESRHAVALYRARAGPSDCAAVARCIVECLLDVSCILANISGRGNTKTSCSIRSSPIRTGILVMNVFEYPA